MMHWLREGDGACACVCAHCDHHHLVGGGEGGGWQGRRRRSAIESFAAAA